MGKLVQVKASVTSVNLPPLDLPFEAGETTVLTDAEYTSLITSVQNSLVVIQSGLPDPVRSNVSNLPASAADAYRMAKVYVDEAIHGLIETGIDGLNFFASHAEVATGDANTLSAAESFATTQITSAITSEASARSAADAAEVIARDAAIAAAISSEATGFASGVWA